MTLKRMFAATAVFSGQTYTWMGDPLNNAYPGGGWFDLDVHVLSGGQTVEVDPWGHGYPGANDAVVIPNIPNPVLAYYEVNTNGAQGAYSVTTVGNGGLSVNQGGFTVGAGGLFDGGDVVIGSSATLQLDSNVSGGGVLSVGGGGTLLLDGSISFVGGSVGSWYGSVIGGVAGSHATLINNGGWFNLIGNFGDGSLAIDNHGSISAYGYLIIDPDAGGFNNAGTFTMPTDVSFIGPGIDNSGTFQIGSNSPLADPSTLTLQNTHVLLTGGGQVDFLYGGVVTMATSGGTLTNANNVVANGGSFGWFDGAGTMNLVNQAPGTFDGAGGSFTYVDLHNLGMMQANSGDMNFRGCVVVNSGSILAAAAAGQSAVVDFDIATGGFPLTTSIVNDGVLGAVGAGSLLRFFAGVTNNREILAQGGGTVQVLGDVSGSGDVLLSGIGGLVDFRGATQHVVFASGAEGTVDVALSQGHTLYVSGFAAGDTLKFGDYLDQYPAQMQYTPNAGGQGGVLTLSNTHVSVIGGTETTEVDFLTGHYAPGAFQELSYGGGGLAELIYVPPHAAPAAPGSVWAANVGGLNGDWSDPSHWTVPSVPSDAEIGGAGSYTVTVQAGGIANSLRVNNAQATLAVGSLLTIGSLALAAGVIDAAGGDLDVQNATAAAGSTLAVSAAGTLTFGGNGTIGGAVSFGSGVGSLWVMPGATVTFAGATRFGDTTSNGYVFADGGGTLVTGGLTALVDPLALGDGFTWKNAGTVNDAVPIGLNVASGADVALVNEAGATFNLTDAQAGCDQQYTAGASRFANAGTLAVLNGASIDNFSMPFTSTGLIDVGSGDLVLGLFVGGSSNPGSVVDTIGGKVTGAGSLELQGGRTYVLSGVNTTGLGTLYVGQATVVFAAATTLRGGLSIQSGMVWVAAGVTVTERGALSLGGGAADVNAVGTVEGPGTFATSGITTVNNDQIYGYQPSDAARLGDGITWVNSGTVDDTGFILLNLSGSDSAAIVNKAGASFDFTDDAGRIGIASGGNGNADTFNNAGTLAKTGGSGTSTVSVALANSGTVVAASGTLALAGAIANSGKLKASSGATLLLEQPVTGGGTLIAGAGGLIELQASGALGQSVVGAGTVELAGGTATTLAGQTVAVATLLVAGGATLAGNGRISGAVTDNGQIEAKGGTLRLAAAQTGAGTLLIDAGAKLELAAASGNATFKGAATLQLDAASQYTGAIGGLAAGDAIVLKNLAAATAVAVSGTALDVTLGNGGTLALATGGGLSGLQFVVTKDASGASSVITAEALNPVAPTFVAAAAPGQSLDGTGLDTVFQGATANFAADTLAGFGGYDALDFTDLGFAAATLAYAGTATDGTLTVSDGTHSAALTLSGGTGYAANMFGLASDGHGGTQVLFL